jgi:hypothetical protein
MMNKLFGKNTSLNLPLHFNVHKAIIPDIISQHIEGAVFLWLLRNAAIKKPHYDFWGLAKLDDRLEADLDGLRIAGDAGWKICKQELTWQEPGEVFAAAVLESRNCGRG